MPHSNPAAATAAETDLFDPGPARPLYARQPHRHGAADPLARRRRGRPGRAAGHLLRPARLGRPHRLRGDQHQRAGQGLYPHARHLVDRAGRRLEADDLGRARQGRPHLPAALARGARLAPRPAAGRRASRCAQRRARRGPAGLHLRRLQAAGHAARAGDRRDSRHRRRLRARGPVRQGCRLRRRRDPLRQRLPAAAVPVRQDQQAHRPVRRLDREPHAPRRRGRRRGDEGVGRRPRRHPPVAADQVRRHRRFQIPSRSICR